MIKIGIYKITSPTNKVYIGQSTDIERRWKKYRDWINHNQPKIFRSIKKYGIENHIFEIIEKCNVDELDKRELYWKQHYLDILGWNNVLFCQLKDGKGGFRSEETKRKMSESNKGRIFSEESKLKMKISRNKRVISKETGQKISQSNKEKNKGKQPRLGICHSAESRNQMSQTRIEKSSSKGSNNGMYGKTHSEETKQKMRESRLKRINNVGE
jgi:group I intron endonuclease